MPKWHSSRCSPGTSLIISCLQSGMSNCELHETKNDPWRIDGCERSCRTCPAHETYDLHAAISLAVRRKGHNDLASVAACLPCHVICSTMIAVGTQTSFATAKPATSSWFVAGGDAATPQSNDASADQQGSKAALAYARLSRSTAQQILCSFVSRRLDESAPEPGSPASSIVVMAPPL